jgi:hypothetical protein
MSLATVVEKKTLHHMVRGVSSNEKGGASRNFCSKHSEQDIQGVREWSPKNFRVSLSGKMWAKTFIRFLDKLNRFLKIKLFPAVLGLLKYCFVHEKKSYKFRLINDCLVTIRNLLLSKFTF